MKYACLFACLFAISLPAVVHAGEKTSRITMKGSYVWENNNDTGDLRAIFTPAQAGEWKVAFYFTFNGEKHIYAGTAKGTLKNGSLSGTVKNESKYRTFNFEGTVKDGTFSGTHSEEGRRNKGTLSLRTAKAKLDPSE